MSVKRFNMQIFALLRPMYLATTTFNKLQYYHSLLLMSQSIAHTKDVLQFLTLLFSANFCLHCKLLFTIHHHESIYLQRLIVTKTIKCYIFLLFDTCYENNVINIFRSPMYLGNSYFIIRGEIQKAVCRHVSFSIIFILNAYVFRWEKIISL